ncbi:MAG: glycerate kinase, partial [Ilumatobacteraceae bacterium]
EKTLTPAEKKKREEIAKAIEKDNPNMPMDKKMAIATATAKRVAEEVELDVLLSDIDMVITGEGFMDSESFAGKVVGSMSELANERKIQIAAICGEIHPDVSSKMNSVSLVETFGREEAFAQPLHCIEHAALKILRDLKI